MPDIPPEVLQRIISHLVEPSPSDAEDAHHQNDLAPLMRVSLTFHHVTAFVLYRDVYLDAADFSWFAIGLDEPAPAAGREEDKLKRKLHKGELLKLVESAHLISHKLERLDSHVLNHIARIHLPLDPDAGDDESEPEQKPAKRARVEELASAEQDDLEGPFWTRCIDVEKEDAAPVLRAYGETDGPVGPLHIKINTLHGASGSSSEEDCLHLLPGCANRVYLRDRKEIETSVSNYNNGWAEEVCAGLFNSFLHRWRELDIPDAPKTTIEFYLPPRPPPPQPQPQQDPPPGGKKKKQKKTREPPEIPQGAVAEMVVKFCAGTCATDVDLLKKDTNGLFDNISCDESEGPGCPACTGNPGDVHSEPTLKMRTRQPEDPEFDPDSLRDDEDEFDEGSDGEDEEDE